MAGIGFELRKLVASRTLGGVLGAAFSGTLIVAGPWLVSAASMTALQRLPFYGAAGVGMEFTGAMVWAFALSICLTAGPLYIFVRYSADLVYEGRKGEAATLLLRYAALQALVSIPVGTGFSLVLAGPGAGGGLLRPAFACLFIAVNTLWAAVMTASVIKRHAGIIVTWTGGMAAMLVVAGALGPRFGAAGAVFALATGFALVALALIALSVASLGLAPLPGALREFGRYVRRYRNLALAGLLYALATWADKAVLSLGGLGAAPEGTRLYLNPSYDNAFYYANLALIPGLVYWTIATETEFYLGLRRLTTWLARRRLPDIVRARNELRRQFTALLGRQTAFQSLLALALALVAPELSRALGFDAAIFTRLLAAGIFQLVFLTALNLLFYLELYRRAALSALAFLGLNLGLSLATVLSGHAPGLQGWPFLASCAAAAALALALGLKGLGRFDRIVFLRASGEEYGL